MDNFTYEPLAFRKLYNVTNLSELLTLQAKASDKMLVVLILNNSEFSNLIKQTALSVCGDYSFIKFATAAQDPSILNKFKVKRLPSIVILNGPQYNLIDKEIHFRLIATIEEFQAKRKNIFETQKQIQFANIDKLLSEKPLMLIIKGTPAEPKCKFTRQLLEAINKSTTDYGFINILVNDSVKQWLKFYSDWYTYPQVYYNKKIVGGVDVITKLIQEGKFNSIINK